MQKPISPAMHGVLDYVTSATVAMAPAMMKSPPRATRVFESLAGGYTALSAVTDYPASVKRIVPFKQHRNAELAIGLALPFLPFVFGFADHKPSRNLCFALTAITGVVAALTDWDAVERERRLD